MSVSIDNENPGSRQKERRYQDGRELEPLDRDPFTANLTGKYKVREGLGINGNLKEIQGPDISADAFNAGDAKVKIKGLGANGMSEGEAYLAREMLRRQAAERAASQVDSQPAGPSWTARPVAPQPVIRQGESAVAPVPTLGELRDQQMKDFRKTGPRIYDMSGAAEEGKGLSALAPGNAGERARSARIDTQHHRKRREAQMQQPRSEGEVVRPTGASPLHPLVARAAAYPAATAARGPVGLSEESASRARVDHLMEHIANMARRGLTGNGSWRGVDLAAQGEDRPTPYAAPGPAMQALIARRRGY
jgi:hypothetical protein